MNGTKDNWYDVTVECESCHDLHYCEIQLNSKREIILVKEVLEKLFTQCHNCGADGEEFYITVYKSTSTTDEKGEYDIGSIIKIDE